MKNPVFSRRAVELSVLFGLLCAVALSFARFEAACDDLRANVLRLHIIANSDDAEDQALKLMVRDRILEETADVFEGKNDLAAAETTAMLNLTRFQAVANEVLRENGVAYSAAVELGDSYFETREYDDFTLPAGTYRSLIIRLGKAEGKNWWCVVFPSICLPAASDARLSDSVGEAGTAIAENPRRYEMRFKTVELYEDFKKIFSN